MEAEACATRVDVKILMLSYVTQLYLYTYGN
jgi:hypothetical protein